MRYKKLIFLLLFVCIQSNCFVLTKRLEQFWVSQNSENSDNSNGKNTNVNLKNNVFKLNGYIRRNNNFQKPLNITNLKRIGYGRAFEESEFINKNYIAFLRH
jgi:hypothetical protein